MLRIAKEEQEKRQKAHDEYLRAFAKEYVKMEKEYEDERRRYREWCENDGIDWSGSGDGI